MKIVINVDNDSNYQTAVYIHDNLTNKARNISLENLQLYTIGEEDLKDEIKNPIFETFVIPFKT